MGEGGPRPRAAASRFASSRCSSIAAASSTRWSRAGRATCTARATRPRCCSGPAAGACSSRRPGGSVDLREPIAACSSRGSRPAPTARRRPNATSSRRSAKGLPPADAIVPGLYDVFVFDAHDPAKAMKDYSVDHRSRRDAADMGARLHAVAPHARRRAQMLGIIDTFRTKKHPARRRDYLGTGFAPRGWNTKQPSFDFNPDVFKRDPRPSSPTCTPQREGRVHMVPWNRDRLPTLRGRIPPRPARGGRRLAHPELLAAAPAAGRRAGIDAFWPDEGDWFNLYERISACGPRGSCWPRTRSWRGSPLPPRPGLWRARSSADVRAGAA